jgi:cation diffusion facilitator family transporter
MAVSSPTYAQHPHDQRHAAGTERRIQAAFWLTAGFMGVEVAAGYYWGSMAVIADGWHMAGHAIALGVALYAERHARRFFDDPRYSFGTGKVSSLAGFASALVLLIATFGMVWEAGERWLSPQPIGFVGSITVAAFGLFTNLLTAWILRGTDAHDHGHAHHDAAHHHGHEHVHDDYDHSHAHANTPSKLVENHNMHAAYLHVLADAVTSLFAIVALLGAMWFGLNWLDPLVALAGAVLILRWAVGLLRSTSNVLLDRASEAPLARQLKHELEADGKTEVVRLTVWSLGEGKNGVIATLRSDGTKRPCDYKDAIAGHDEVGRVIVEVHDQSCC